MLEIFKEHYDYNILVSNFGRFKFINSKSNRYQNYISIGHKTRRAGNGTTCELQAHVRLKSTNIRVTRRTHRLIAEVWLPLPTRPMKELVIDHIDGNAMNNKIENLQWVTNIENLKRSHAKRKEKKLTDISLSRKFNSNNLPRLENGSIFRWDTRSNFNSFILNRFCKLE